MMTTAGSGDTGVVGALIERAVSFSAAVAGVLEQLEVDLAPGTKALAEGRLPVKLESLPKTTRETVNSYSKKLIAEQQWFGSIASLRGRFVSTVIPAWFDRVSSRSPSRRPDVLEVTCRLLADPCEPRTWDIVRFSVALALRHCYGIAYNADEIRSLRLAYDDISRRFDRQLARRQRHNAGRHESFIIDLLSLDGSIRRTLSGENRNEYYGAFRRAPFGIERARRTFAAGTDWPQLVGSPPDFATVLNLTFAQPAGVPGLDEITGGLIPVPTSEEALPGGLVTLIAGRPGTGKTSLCLSIARAMAEMGSYVRYVATEESVTSLHAKVASLGTADLAALWPNLLRVESRDAARFEILRVRDVYGLAQILDTLEREFGETAPVKTAADVFLAFPRVLVVDSVTSLLHVEGEHGLRAQLAGILADFRRLGINVMLAGGLGDQTDSGLAHLVDNVFVLDFEDEESKRHPVRILSVEKTRLQASHRGRHVFHLSRDVGCSVSPSLHSVLRRLKDQQPPSRSEDLRAVLWEPPGEEVGPLTLASPAHIVVYGAGSAGKAGFALSVALEPRRELPRSPKSPPSGKGRAGLRRLPDKRRVLLLSFLYPKKYYTELTARILRERFGLRQLEEQGQDCISVLEFYPGYIDPETLTSRVRMHLAKARFEGRAYDAVVVDGLHNMLIQFPLLMRDPLLWPTLLLVFQSEGLDVVSTFTFFRAPSLPTGQAVSAPLKKGDLMLEGSEHAFYQLLVRSCDYTFMVERREPAGPPSDEPNLVHVRVVSSIDGFAHRPSAFLWDPAAFCCLAENGSAPMQP